ncbi:MAG: enoyl-CoA hydratase/isomerase family protein [Candidatus Binataceae bacterium]|nr:enoyl-CoA hydratase/isomerase family protein [Candidatus Binataceae bacterium]
MIDYSRYQFIKVEKAESIATVTLNRPQALNAVNAGLHHELVRIWIDLADDDEIDAIVLTGAGRAFCAGGDMKEMAGDSLVTDSGTGITIVEARKLVERMLDVEQPIIGAINGDAVGLGATIALLCDITVAAETARLADTHVRAGVVAGDGGAVLWPLLIGPSRAKEFLMRGHFVNGTQAAAMGLVNYAVPAEQVMSRARELASELAQGPTLAIRGSKSAVNKWLKQQVNLIVEASLGREMETFHTSDHREAVAAFVEKRKPKFTGK